MKPLLESAHRGVLFLDEIGETDENIQRKVLRFLEERAFYRLGSTQPIQVDVQIVTATNAALEARVQEKQFREDFYFRLKVHEIILPPLREREEDIPLLAQHFLHLLRQRGKRVYGISVEALGLLQHFSWPGNVRQLKNTIESAVFWAEFRGHQHIEIVDLPADVHQATPVPVWESLQRLGDDRFSIHEALARAELAYVEAALQRVQGKKTEVWKLLGYSDRFALYRRVRRILAQYPHLREEFPHVG